MIEAFDTVCIGKYDQLYRLNPDKIDTGVIHISESLEENTTNELLAQWHKENFGAIANGYSFVLYPKANTLYTARGLNRVGAHCAGHNSHTWGLCVVGDYLNTEPSEEVYAQIRVAISIIDKQLGRPVPLVRHGDLYPTGCPGMINIRKLSRDSTMYPDTQWSRDVLESYKVLQQAGIINTPEYWAKQTLTGQPCNPEYVERVLLGMADYIRKGGKR